MKNELIKIMLLLSILSGCAPTSSARQTPNDPAAEIIIPSLTPSPIPEVRLPETEEVLFTIPNPEPFSGREGEARPDWLGWGARTFTVAPDSSIWIADTAVFPNRLLRYSPQGELLQKISLENLVVFSYDLAVTQESLWLLDISSQPAKIVEMDRNGEFPSNISFPKEIMSLNGQTISNGAFDLLPGEKGELFLLGMNGYYKIVDELWKVMREPSFVP